MIRLRSYSASAGSGRTCPSVVKREADDDAADLEQSLEWAVASKTFISFPNHLAKVRGRFEVGPRLWK
jgi:hypothetical protein